MPETTLTDIEQAAIELVNKERTQWEDATAFITPRVAFRMRDLIRTLRKNYWGVFDVPTDKVTGSKKIWIPLTESNVGAVRKNIDLDTKDTNFRSKNPGAIGLTPIVRSLVRNNLDEIYFGEFLDELLTTIAIDGTAVWKTLEKKDDNGRVLADIRMVDLLNLYIDPTARSIQEAYRFTERALLSPDDIKGMTGWRDTGGVLKTKEGLDRVDSFFTKQSNNTNAKFRDTWEMWGQIPKWLITGEAEDMDSGEEIEGHIVVSGIEAGDRKVHLIEKNLKGLRPYEEAWYERVPGRWYGKGVAEKLQMLQLWMNIVVNVRINRHKISQLGIFKVRRGSGITAQMLSRLAANGVIMVNNQEDIEQMVVNEASQSSYTDEGVIKDWAERVTAAFEVVTGERLPAETTATAVAVQGQAAQSAFVLIKEGVGMFIQRWVKRHALPIITKNVRPGDIVRLSGTPEELQEWDNALIDQMLFNEIDRIQGEGKRVTPESIIIAKEIATDKFRKMGADRYAKITKSIDFSEYDVQVMVTNETLDPAVVAQNLVTILQAVQDPGQRDAILRQLMDSMGLDPNLIKPSQVQEALPQTSGEAPGEAPQRRGRPLANAQQILTGATTRER